MYVLVIGFRKGLVKALTRMQIPYSLLVTKLPQSKLNQVKIISVSQFPSNPSQLKQTVLEIENSKVSPTHIIAAVESAVYPASLLRQALNCRSSAKSIIRRCSNKSDMKVFLSKFEVPMTDFLTSSQVKTVDDVAATLSLPLVVKDASNSGGRGIQFVNNRDELQKNMGKNRIYEKIINGAEGSIESFVNHGEILFSSVTEYYIKKFSNLVPASYEDPILKAIHGLNQLVIKSLGIKWGMTHLEYYLTDNGLLFGEIALRPPGGYIMKLIKSAYDFDPWEALVSVELDLAFTFPKAAQKYAACLLYHPGEGTIESVNEVTSPSLEKHRFKLKAGDTVSRRIGVGEDIGYTTFSDTNVNLIKQDINDLVEQPPFSYRKNT